MAFKEAYREHGVELPLEQYSECIGTSLHAFNPYEYLVTDLHLPIDLDDFRASVHARHRQLMDREAVRPGVIKWLQYAKEHHLRIGLATSSRRAWIDPFLDGLDIRDYFDCIKTADDVEHVKPDPALYEQALQCLGVLPNEAIAVEDSPNGSEAALRAGVYCLVVPNPVTKPLHFGHVHWKVDSLEDIDFAELLAQYA